MRIFCASVATETNSFSPLRTDLSDFQQSFYAGPGDHPQTPTLCSAVFPALRARADNEGFTLIEGTATWAEPGGLINAHAWAHLKEEILAQVRDALPLDAVVLGLHGAMIADGCVDCEGALIEAIRRTVGPRTIIGVTFDPHSHLSQKRVDNANIIVAFKEFPHTDFVETGETCVSLVLRAVRGDIQPVLSVFDVKMIDVLPTSRPPMRQFVDRMRVLEETGQVLSISAIHGFMAGDSPDVGAKMVVVTDNAKSKGDEFARTLGMELFSFRGRARPDFLSPLEALKQASEATDGPVVVADVWDNPGGGVAGDSTLMLREAIALGLSSVAFGTIWDPMAVRLCHAAGEGARVDLRFGGKTSFEAGDPIDARVEVLRNQRDAVQSFGTSVVPMGDCSVIKLPGGIEVVLNSNRSQAFSPDLFTNLGIDPAKKKVLVVKSTNHFHGAFASLAADVLYAAIDGPYPSDPAKTRYTRLKRAIWPIVGDPHREEAA